MCATLGRIVFTFSLTFSGTLFCNFPIADSQPHTHIQFPYALTALPATLAAEWSTPAFAPYRAAFPPEHASSPAALEAHVQDLMRRDVKIAYLKSLQGYLWESGYASGALKAPLFADVAPAVARWQRAGVAVVIYSSGSVAAQKLLFRHTDAGDLTPLLTDYFDTINAGPKQDSASYEAIAACHPELGPPRRHAELRRRPPRQCRARRGREERPPRRDDL